MVVDYSTEAPTILGLEEEQMLRELKEKADMVPERN